ncbi:SARP family transcriptional regulator [Sphaerisporangium melleum]|uniref:SARP family transcriptional regulator n=1 Tax=Sphaerisporangium melleum TaxID=321316 RepID=A0A917RRF3_9ACTN|nr:BTAD domain-containing putative transcriptional regulator [Sphaerisporangium melleum]GGL21362.1 SARP family transcriptional regulator [Sphaerisporangium melleum]GII67769.1 SARP family transcriptional regulator [Sphaerisporangium melleum]
MEFRLLGPIEVWNGGRQVPLGGAKPRTALTALLIDEGHVVRAERLIEAIWSTDPPETSRAVLQTYISSLRRSFERAGMPPVIVSHRAGYLADVPTGTVDRSRFETLAAEGRRAATEGRHEEASERLRAALALWRGPALGGIGDSFLLAEARRLDELRLTVTEERISADLRLGLHEQVIGELTALVARHPTHERLRYDLMATLNELGRRGDALAVYRQGVEALAEELGIDPGPELRRLHEGILRGDPRPSPEHRSRTRRPQTPAPTGPAATSTGGGRTGTERTAPERTRPYQLPPVIPDFTGRAEETVLLRAALTRPSAMPVCVILGAGGTGKSTLALRVAHDMAEHYPDGQLYAELRGTTELPATPEEVLGRLLRELGTPAPELPPTLEERVNRYRTLLSGRRVLVVLDDAATERQVRPLLPGSAGCAVLITSRNKLPSLAGAVPTELGTLTVDAALALLSHVAGADRVTAEAEPARMIVRQCGYLPLAIRIAGARLASRRQWSVKLMADRLADERRRLDELAVGDQEVRAGIALSYELLTDSVRRALRYLGLLGLPHFPAWVAAAATGASLEEAERQLEQLVDASLVEVDGVDAIGQVRYRLHDLIRLFARERAEAEDPGQARVTAVTRVLGGWLWLLSKVRAVEPSGTIAVRESYRLTVPIDPEAARAVLAAPHTWFRIEEEPLVVGVELAAALDLDEAAVELASALCHSAFAVENQFTAWSRTHDAALSVARRKGNTAGQATLLAELGQLRYEQDRYAEAQDYFGQALPMFRAAGDLRGECAILTGMGTVCRERGHLREALHYLDSARAMWHDQGDGAALAHVQRLAGSVRLEQGDLDGAWKDLDHALALYRGSGSRRGEALTLRTMALHHLARGEHAEAERLSEQAAHIFGGMGERLLECYALRTRAKAWLRQGRCDEALPELEGILTDVRALRDRWGEAITLRTLGELHLAVGRLQEAEGCLTESVRQWEELGLPLFRARTLRDLALLYEERDRRAAAESARAEAVEIFRAHGSREHAELAPREAVSTPEDAAL